VAVLNVGTSSPIQPDLLRPILRPIGLARTLPARAYLSDAVLAWERRQFFDSTWVCAGRSSTMAEPGDQRAVRLGTEGVLLVRGDHGALNAFSNVCRHRGHELLDCGEIAHRRAIKCPYHAWVYGLDGRLRAAPRFGHLPADDPVHEGLVPVRAAEWNGWIFVNSSDAGPDLRNHVGSLDDLLRQYGVAGLVAGATQEYEVEANWKLVVENYHECYHCPSIHPELCMVTPTESGVNFQPQGLWAGGSMDLKAHAETMSMDGRSGGVPIAGLDPALARQVFYFGLFPNLLIRAVPV
jgi:Rieske 2Fe-2S family protein